MSHVLSHLPSTFDSLDARIVQYKYAITKLELLIAAVDSMLGNVGASDTSTNSPTPLVLVQYLVHLLAAMFAINDAGFAPRLAQLELFRPIKPAVFAAVPISQVVTHVPYDVKDVDVVPLQALPRAAMSVLCLRSFRAALVACLEGYRRRYANALREINLPQYMTDLDVLFREELFGTADLDLTLQCRVHPSFQLDLGPDAPVDDAADAALVDMDLQALFSLQTLLGPMMARMAPLIAKYREIRQKPSAQQAAALDTLPYPSYLLHRVLFWALRLNDLYSVVRRFGRHVILGNAAHLHDSGFIAWAPNPAQFRAAVADMDDCFTAAKKNGVLVATITRFLRMRPTDARTVVEFIVFVHQSATYLDSMARRLRDFGTMWLAGELAFRKHHGLPTARLEKLDELVRGDAEARARPRHILRPSSGSAGSKEKVSGVTSTGNAKAGNEKTENKADDSSSAGSKANTEATLGSKTASNGTATANGVTSGVAASSSISRGIPRIQTTRAPSSDSVGAASAASVALNGSITSDKGSPSVSSGSSSSTGSHKYTLARGDSASSAAGVAAVAAASAPQTAASPTKSLSTSGSNELVRTRSSPARPRRPQSMIFLQSSALASSLQVDTNAKADSDTETASSSAPGGRRRSNSQPLSLNAAATAALKLPTSPLSPSASVRRASKKPPARPLKAVAETPAAPTRTAAQKFQQHLRDAERSGTLMRHERDTFTNVVFDPSNPTALRLRRQAEKLVSLQSSQQQPPNSPPSVPQVPLASTLQRTGHLESSLHRTTQLAAAQGAGSLLGSAAGPQRITVAQVTRRNTKRNSKLMEVPDSRPSADSVGSDSTPTSSTSDSLRRVRFTGVPAYTPAEDAPSTHASRILKNFATFKVPLINRASHAAFRKKEVLLKKEESLSFRQQLHPPAGACVSLTPLR